MPRMHRRPAITDPALLVRFGKVIEVDTNSATARVGLGDIETQPLPWAMGRCGKTRIWSPPSVGEQVIVIAPDGDMEGAVIFGALAQNDYPPAGNSARELIRFEDGAEFSYDPENHVLKLKLPAGGKLQIDGDVEVDGDIDATGDVKAGDISLSTHTHGGVESGASNTGAPQ